MNKADIGLIGLAVMGENLVHEHGIQGLHRGRVTTAPPSKVTDFVNGRAKGKNIIGTYSIEELCASLSKPRKVMLMVKAGQPVDDFIEKLLPHLEDGRRHHRRRQLPLPGYRRAAAQYVESKGLLYIGTGVSGGEEGALNGPQHDARRLPCGMAAS